MGFLENKLEILTIYNLIKPIMTDILRDETTQNTQVEND